MKRTTIMVNEELLYELQQIAQDQKRSTSSVIREALAVYVVEEQKKAPPTNPLLAIVGLGQSESPMKLGDGGDEALLCAGVDPITGWSVVDDSDR